MRLHRSLLLLPALLLALPAQAASTLVLQGERDADAAGHQLATGDFDGDGHLDLLVGAYGSDRGGDRSGAVYLQYGPITRSSSLGRVSAILHTPVAGDFVGEGPLAVADLDGDGRDDLVLGAPGAFLTGQPGSPGKVGEAFLLYGGPRLRGDVDLSRRADAVFTGLQKEEWLGFGSHGVGDLDRDGTEELLVGAPATAGYSGAAYLFYGSKQRLKGAVSVLDADATLVGGTPDGGFGYEATGGDLDGDGFADLAVTGYPLNTPALNPVALFYGGRERLTGVLPAAAADAVLVDALPSNNVRRLLVADDLTGDGRRDLVVGDAGTYGPSTNRISPRRTWVVAGGARLQGPQLLDRVARTTVVGAGGAVAAGRWTADARTDLAVGDEVADTVTVLTGPLPAGAIDTSGGAVWRGPKATKAGTSLLLADLGGSRRPELVVGATAGTGRVIVVRQ